MNAAVPVIYLLHGDDEFAIKQSIADLQAKNEAEAGSMADLNTASLDGRTAALDEVRYACLVLPFLAGRRLVIYHNPLARFRRPARFGEATGDADETDPAPGSTGGAAKKDREALVALLDSVPPTTALVLAEYQLLDDASLQPPYSKKKMKDHWLVRWAKANPTRTFYKVHELPRGPALVRWIQNRARALGGKFNSDAAEELGSLVGGDTRSAENEINKLLAYVNYARPVAYEDVALLTADIAETSIFDVVDAIGERNGTAATRLLNRLLAEDDPQRIFGMVVRQFRLLLMARAVIEESGGEAEIAHLVKVHPFVARKLNEQARRFTTPDLEGLYHRLLEIDQGVKLSQVEMPVALNTLVAATTR